MRISGHILAKILNELKKIAKPGMKTSDIDSHAENLMKSYRVTPSFKGYHGYPKVTCICINEEIVHAIPGNRIIQPGDIMTIDCGVIYHGFHSDSAITVGFQPLSSEVKRFIKTADKALENAIQTAQPGKHVGDISWMIQQTVEKNGYSVVQEFTGHGIGRELHEPPPVPNEGKRGKGPALIPGMTLAIEPIFVMGKRQMRILDDKWTAITQDGSLAIQVEHTILITPTGAEVLTRKSEKN